LSIAALIYHHVKVAYDNFDNKQRYDDDVNIRGRIICFVCVLFDWSKLNSIKLPQSVWDWQSTLLNHNCRFCKVRNDVTQKLGHISKIRPHQMWILCPSLRIIGQLVASSHCKWRRI